MDDVELNKRRKRLGNAVRVERVEQRLSQERLGRMVGTNQTYISLLEAGEINVTFNKLCRIAEALEVEVSDLVRKSAPALPGTISSTYHRPSSLCQRCFVLPQISTV